MSDCKPENEWTNFIQTVKKLERKNKFIICRKRFKGVFMPVDDQKQYKEIDYRKVDDFSKNEKRSFESHAMLDLHGYTEEKAYAAIMTFLENSYQRGFRNLIIITGGSANSSKKLRKMFVDKISTDFSPLIAKVTCPSDNTGSFWIKLRKRQ